MCAVGRKESRMSRGSHALLPCTAVRDLDGGQVYGRSGWMCSRTERANMAYWLPLHGGGDGLWFTNQ